MTDTEAPSLLPCPFCGSPAEEINRHTVRCCGCNAEINTANSPNQEWNERVTPPSSALGEEIRKLARELREKAIKATAGEWQRRDTPDYAEIVTEGHNLAMVATEKDADHIAACDPPTIIHLCNAVLNEQGETK